MNLKFLVEAKSYVRSIILATVSGTEVGWYSRGS